MADMRGVVSDGSYTALPAAGSHGEKWLSPTRRDRAYTQSSRAFYSKYSIVDYGWYYSPLLPHGGGGLKDSDARLRCLSCRSLPDLDDWRQSPAELDEPLPCTVSFWWRDWDELSMVEKLAKVGLDYYHSTYMAYLIFIIAMGAIALLATGEFSIGGALFMSCSSVTQAGLAIVNYAECSAATHMITLALIIAGSQLLLTLIPVLLRRVAYWSFRSWCLEKRVLLPSRDEHGALELLTRIVVGYWLAVTFIGFVLLHGVDFPSGNHAIWRYRHSWNSIFMASSAIQNSGLALTPSSLEHVATDQYVLYVMALLVILGNTGVPICLRMVTALCFRLTTRGRRTHDRLALLLSEPRHFYTHIFSAVHTTWLLVCLIFLIVGQFALSALLDWGSDVFEGFSVGDRLANIFFQAASTRTAGLNSLPLEQLSLPTNYIFVVCMYINTSPVTVAMRSTNVRVTTDKQMLRDQMSTYFTQHATLLVIFMLLILMFEIDHMTAPNYTCDSAAACDLRGSFSFFKIAYELVSAYGTVGLSLGSITGNSFCADWTTASRVVLCAAMLLGRTRDLPHSINHPFHLESWSHEAEQDPGMVLKRITKRQLTS